MTTESATLIIDQFGSYLGKHSERLQVKVKGEIIAEAPLLTLQAVLILSHGVSLSSDAVRSCAENGIPIYYLSSRGEPYAALYAAGLSGMVATRRAQYEACCDARGVALATAFATGKLQNQARLLKYLAKNRKTRDPNSYAILQHAAQQVLACLEEIKAWQQKAPDLKNETARAELLSSEGRAAQAYWEGIRALVPEALAWPGREGRGARDPFNAALNYGYGVLYGQVERTLLLAGLDPYAGFIHTDRPGKPSLVLDFIEEYRAPIVDRVILALIGQGVALQQDEEDRLDMAVRRLIAERVLERLEESTERYEGKRQKLRWIMQQQARHLATYLRGDRPVYQPFVMGW